MNCPSHPAGQLCSSCDPSPAVRRAHARQQRRQARQSAARVTGYTPAQIAFLAPFALLVAVVLVTICPILPFILIGLMYGVACARARARFTKVAIDYAAVRFAEEIAARR